MADTTMWCMVMVGLSVALLISIITNFSLLSQLESARSCINSLIAYMKKIADEMDQFDTGIRKGQIAMEDKTFFDDTDFYSAGEPEKEYPDEIIIYDWNGGVIYEAE